MNKSMQPELALIDATKVQTCAAARSNQRAFHCLSPHSHPAVLHTQVCEIFPLHLAAFKALMHESRKTMKTHTIHSEVVFMLSGSKHIAEAYRVFGPSDTTTHLLGEPPRLQGEANRSMTLPALYCADGHGSFRSAAMLALRNLDRKG